MRWFVGDLQGCARPLDRLLRIIDFSPGRDELWAVGDLVNRGPDHAETLRLWRSVGGRGVLGNHDLYALAIAGERRARHGDTLDDLLTAVDAATLLASLAALPVLAQVPAPGATDLDAHDLWVVHAGLSPAWADLDDAARQLAVARDEALAGARGLLAEALSVSGRSHAPHATDAPANTCAQTAAARGEMLRFATRARCCTATGALCSGTGPPSSCTPPCAPWDTYYQGGTRVVHGHWASRGHYVGRTTIGLDSGCVYGRTLTAWCHDDGRIVNVPCT